MKKINSIFTFMRTMKLKYYFISSLVIASLAGCSSDDLPNPAPYPGPPGIASEIQFYQMYATTDYIAQAASTYKGQNWVISPYSTLRTLGLLYNAADYQNAIEYRSVLNLKEYITPADVNQYNVWQEKYYKRNDCESEIYYNNIFELSDSITSVAGKYDIDLSAVKNADYAVKATDENDISLTNNSFPMYFAGTVSFENADNTVTTTTGLALTGSAIEVTETGTIVAIFSQASGVTLSFYLPNGSFEDYPFASEVLNKLIRSIKPNLKRKYVVLPDLDLDFNADITSMLVDMGMKNSFGMVSPDSYRAMFNAVPNSDVKFIYETSSSFEMEYPDYNERPEEMTNAINPSEAFVIDRPFYFTLRNNEIVICAGAVTNLNK